MYICETSVCVCLFEKFELTCDYALLDPVVMLFCYRQLRPLFCLSQDFGLIVLNLKVLTRNFDSDYTILKHCQDFKLNGKSADDNFRNRQVLNEI